MARASIGWIANATTTTLAPRIEFIGRTTGPRTRLMELGVFDEAATAQVIGFGFSLAKGVTPTTPLSAIGEDQTDSGIVTATAIAWGTAPTLPTTVPLRRFSMPAAIGAGIVWSWANGLFIPLATTSLILWNIGTGSAALGGYAVFDE